ncbi:MAG: S1C family serine protease, partial [Gammaproteobacteria bacterium]|nr:S1C family serine protease [Gammaproteobacteria bacterium]
MIGSIDPHDCAISDVNRRNRGPRRSPAGALLGVVVWAASGAAAPAAEPTVDELLSAVVQVRASVPGDARTAATLGTERSGSGVVIDGNGLVVTVGYLILEADSVSVVSADERALPAEIVAYDHESGLGLLRVDPSVAAMPMRLGDSARLKQRDPLLVASFGGREAARPAVLVARRDFAGYWEYLLENALFTWPPHPLFGGAALVTQAGELVG